MIAIRTIFVSLLVACFPFCLWGGSEPASNSDDTIDRQLQQRLEWFQDQKFGLLIHWGAYSQWGCIESWPLVEEDKWARPDDLKAWTDRNRDIELFKKDYWTLPRTFNPTNFDPTKWSKAAKHAGIKYVVFTTKHHDGFCMFDTKLTEYRITAPDCEIKNMVYVSWVSTGRYTNSNSVIGRSIVTSM